MKRLTTTFAAACLLAACAPLFGQGIVYQSPTSPLGISCAINTAYVFGGAIYPCVNGTVGPPAAGGSTISAYTVATLPATTATGTLAIATDALTAGSCIAGSGSALSLCRWSGAAWTTVGGSGGTGTLINAYTVATLPASPANGLFAMVTDASPAGSCTVGSGTGKSLCFSAASAWGPVGSVIDASAIVSGTVAAARGGAGAVNGALKANGAGAVSQAACADLSNASPSCATDATNASNISSGTLAAARVAVLNQNSTGTSASLAGGILGGLPYQLSPGNSLFLAGNTAATDQVLVSHGTGSAALAPTLSNAPALSAANMTNLPAATPCTTTALSIQYNAAGALGCISNGTYTLATGLWSIAQLANGNNLVDFSRFTDTSPTGYFMRWKTAAGAIVGSVDVLGNLVGNSLSATASGFNGILDLGAGTGAILPNNTWGWIGNGTQTTSWWGCPPNASPTANQVMVFPAPTSNQSCWTWTNFASTGLTDTANLVYNNAVNAGTAAMSLNLSASTVASGLRTPVGAGRTATATGALVFDSTANNYHGYSNGADAIIPAIASAPTTGHCAGWLVSASNVLLTDAGACGGSSAPAFPVNAQTTTYTVVAGDFAACKTINVASGTFTITLVASGSQPTAGQCIWIENYGTGVVTVARSGQQINGGTTSLSLTAGTSTAPTGAFIVSDGANYEAQVFGEGSAGAVSSVNGNGGAVTVCGPPGSVSNSLLTDNGSSGCADAGQFTYSGSTLSASATAVLDDHLGVVKDGVSAPTTQLTDFICNTTSTVAPYACTANVGTTLTYFANPVATIATAATANTVDGTHATLRTTSIFDAIMVTASTAQFTLSACSALSGQTCTGNKIVWQSIAANVGTGEYAVHLACDLFGTSTATTFDVSCEGGKLFAPNSGVSPIRSTLPNNGTNWILVWSVTYSTAGADANAIAQIATKARFEY